MNPLLLIIIILGYFGILIIISLFTSKNVNNEGFFIGNRRSPWYVVAIGMLGTSISGVTFISVPGWVQTTQMTYMQMVFGFVLGYAVIAYVLLPVYYRLKLPSIYTYLDERFGNSTYKTGALFFLFSRLLGSALRLFVVAYVLHFMIFDKINIHFSVTVIITLLFIWFYTFKGGIKTIIWTDLLQTFFMFTALIITIILIAKDLNFGFVDTVSAIYNSDMSKMFEFSDWYSKQHFVKQFISGALTTIVMTGLDQDMMQKNLSCRNLKDARKNMISYGFAFLPANLLFLSLGVLLMIFAQNHGIDPSLIEKDSLYPYIAENVLGQGVLLLFIIGLMSSAYSSADSALTALTTSFTVDILGIKNKTENQIKKTRKITHILMSLALGAIIMIIYEINQKSIIDAIYTVASYTYGPLLGLYSFGLFTKIKVKEKLVPTVAIASPLLCLGINYLLKNYLGYTMGYELLLMNGGITFIGLMLMKSPAKNS